ncbi:MAG: rhamnulokinase family protein [Clostridiales bacterium]|nr:rhamnulokinase family protein [Clostridiales bacterium]
MRTVNVLGMDYGASTGRGMVGKFNGNKLMIEEIHRFQNNPVTVLSNMYWDVLGLFNELKNSIIKTKIQSISVSSVGIDTWAMDFGILDEQGNLLGNPHTYRDKRTNDILVQANKIFDEYEVFLKTGIYPLHICTLYQLIAMKSFEQAFLEKGRTLLFMPNLLNYFLTGETSSESTLASTSLLYSPFNGDWVYEFLDNYQLPDILPAVKKPGGIIGNVSNVLMQETGIGKIPVISVAQHDTASAIAAVPAKDKQKIAYISCGTWSVVGTAIEKPLVNRDVIMNRFNNEIGYDDEIMFVKNITGLWVLQECVREWAIEGYKIDYRHMDECAGKSSFGSYIDIEDEVFASPGNMNKKVVEYCRKTSQTLPETKEEVYQCIVLSLAMKYRDIIYQTEKLTGKRYKKIHMVGGGSRNKALCRLTAAMTGMEVIAGPFEATVIGNILAQLISLGEIRDMVQAVEIIEKSFNMEAFV